MSVDFCRTGARFSCLILLFVSSGRKKARADCEAVGLCLCPAGSVPPGGAALMLSGRCLGLRPGVGRASALCSGSGFLRCVRLSAIGEAWPPRLRFRPSPRALSAVRTQRRPWARNRPAMRQRTAPAERRLWQAVRPCACAFVLPEGAAVAVPCLCLRGRKFSGRVDFSPKRPKNDEMGQKRGVPIKNLGIFLGIEEKII